MVQLKNRLNHTAEVGKAMCRNVIVHICFMMPVYSLNLNFGVLTILDCKIATFYWSQFIHLFLRPKMKVTLICNINFNLEINK